MIQDANYVAIGMRESAKISKLPPPNSTTTSTEAKCLQFCGPLVSTFKEGPEDVLQSSAQEPRDSAPNVQTWRNLVEESTDCWQDIWPCFLSAHSTQMLESCRSFDGHRCLEDLPASADDHGGTRQSGLWMTQHGRKDGTSKGCFNSRPRHLGRASRC